MLIFFFYFCKISLTFVKNKLFFIEYFGLLKIFFTLYITKPLIVPQLHSISHSSPLHILTKNWFWIIDVRKSSFAHLIGFWPVLIKFLVFFWFMLIFVFLYSLVQQLISLQFFDFFKGFESNIRKSIETSIENSSIRKKNQH